MARVIPTLASTFITISILLSFLTITAAGEYHAFVKPIDRKKLGLGKEKLSHFRFYFHDVLSGPNPTAVPVVRTPNRTASGFGSVTMIDDPLTEGPELSSKLIGRAQGLYAFASQKEIGLLMSMNFAFVEGKYNGSTIAVVGRNAVMSKVREMPVVGGSGIFRWARGYVEARTHSLDMKSGDATVEYNVYVMHY